MLPQKENYIKSPLNFVGGKHKLLPQILPHFPSKINTFVDMYCGGCNVSVNINANKIIAVDKQKQIIELFNKLKQIKAEQVLAILHNNIEKYKLSKTNKDGYIQLRNDYNINPTWNKFFLLVAHSFGNHIRFNKKDEFNLPFGKRTFNKKMQSNLISFMKQIKNINIEFICSDFREFDLSSLTEDDFVYFDPPYLLSVATYNENGGWTSQDEQDMYKILDNLNKRGVRFALSNVTKHKGIENEMLLEWVNKYKIINLNYNYINCNYQVKNKDKNSTQEVLIINY